MSSATCLYRELIYLMDWLRSAQGIDLRIPNTPTGPESTEWRDAIDDVLSRIRQLNATATRDRYQLILDPLPDAVNAAYVNLFRSRTEPFGQFVDQLRLCQSPIAPSVRSSLHDARRTSAGGTQRSAFPDGLGGISIDDYGFPGYWEYSVDSCARVTTITALRTVDALSKAGGNGGHIRFLVAHRDDPWWDAARHELAVPDTFALLSRRQQIDRLANSREWHDLVPMRELPLPQPIHATQRARAMLVTLAGVHTGKARDYTHFRFNYRISVLAQTLCDDGIDATSRSIEDPPSYAAFVNAFREDPVDVVVISFYQHKPEDMRLLADLLRDLRAVRSEAFIVLEGVATQPAKQMLALFPGVDMLVRGESEAVVRALLAVKERGRPLTGAQRDMFLRENGSWRPGVFLRTAEGGVFSSLDCEQQDDEPRLLRPERHMQSVWYSERGCPSTCGYCPLYTGHQSRARVVSADRRIQWMLDRLTLEFTEPATVDDATLRKWLTTCADGSALLRDDEPHQRRLALRDDTFIGSGKVTITTVSQNALVNRPVWLSFCRQVCDLGLQKYFRIKVADTSINTMWRNMAPDRELIRALKNAGVFFIGFGTESLSERILNDLRKGHGHKDASDYHADAPIHIAAALREEHFPIEGVRHNFMSNAPESRLEDVLEGMVLAYVGPLFNHSIERLGNGWGNSRQNRLYAIEGSLHTAVDTLRHGHSYRFTVPDHATLSDGISLLGDFFVCHAAPEYMVRSEEGRLTYIDERLQPLTTAFTYPTFYRYAMADVLRANVSDDGIMAMRRQWENGASLELRALARIAARYQQGDPRLSNLDALFQVKAHMLSLECFLFSEWEERLERVPALPGQLEQAGIATLIAEADQLMRPAGFDPGAALGKQMLAAKRAASTWSALQQLPPAYARSAIEGLNSREAEVRTRGLHTLLSYPESQQFDDLCRACISTPAAVLFDQLIQEMRTSGATVAAAVRHIVRRVLQLREGEFDQFVKLLKAYETIPFFADGGPLFSLHGTDPVRRTHAIADVRQALDATSNPMMRRLLEYNLALSL